MPKRVLIPAVKPSIVEKYRSWVLAAKPFTKLIDKHKDEVRAELLKVSYPGEIFLSKPKPTRELDLQEAHQMIQEYFKAELITDKQMDSLYVKVLNPEAIWKAIRANMFNKKDLWHAADEVPKRRKNGTRRRRVVVVKKATPSIQVR